MSRDDSRSSDFAPRQPVRQDARVVRGQRRRRVRQRRREVGSDAQRVNLSTDADDEGLAAGRPRARANPALVVELATTEPGPPAPSAASLSTLGTLGTLGGPVAPRDPRVRGHGRADADRQQRAARARVEPAELRLFRRPPGTAAARLLASADELSLEGESRPYVHLALVHGDSPAREGGGDAGAERRGRHRHRVRRHPLVYARLRGETLPKRLFPRRLVDVARGLERPTGGDAPRERDPGFVRRRHDPPVTRRDARHPRAVPDETRPGETRPAKLVVLVVFVIRHRERLFQAHLRASHPRLGRRERYPRDPTGHPRRLARPRNPRRVQPLEVAAIAQSRRSPEASSGRSFGRRPVPKSVHADAGPHPDDAVPPDPRRVLAARRRDPPRREEVAPGVRLASRGTRLRLYRQRLEELLPSGRTSDERARGSGPEPRRAVGGDGERGGERRVPVARSRTSGDVHDGRRVT